MPLKMHRFQPLASHQISVISTLWAGRELSITAKVQGLMVV